MSKAEAKLHDLLARAIEKAGGLRALGRQLDWSHPNLHRVLKGEKISPYRAAQTALFLNLPADEWVRLALEAGSKTDAERRFWRDSWGSRHDVD